MLLFELAVVRLLHMPNTATLPITGLRQYDCLVAGCALNLRDLLCGKLEPRVQNLDFSLEFLTIQ